MIFDFFLIVKLNNFSIFEDLTFHLSPEDIDRYQKRPIVKCCHQHRLPLILMICLTLTIRINKKQLELNVVLSGLSMFINNYCHHKVRLSFAKTNSLNGIDLIV